MGGDFKEVAHLKTNLEKYNENYDSINWGVKTIKEPIEGSMSKTTSAITVFTDGEWQDLEKLYSKNLEDLKWAVKNLDWDSLDKKDTERAMLLHKKFFPENF